MSIHHHAATALTAVAFFGLATDALAEGRNPGSLLVYPLFDNTEGVVSVLTVTNTATNVGDVEVEFVYIGRFGPKGREINCEEFNRVEILTDNDTLTLITTVHNPQQEEGYVYLFAREGVENPIVHNWLIGNMLHVNGLEAFEFSVNPVAYEGFAGDLNGNGLRDLDGNEYGTSPAEILVPRFFGQPADKGNSPFDSDLILIDLTGGAAFDTTVDFLIYNDNEEIFSAEYTFHCWEEVNLTDISLIFTNDFLRDFTNQDPQEILGAPQYESGWFRVRGALASSSTTTIPDPAIYALLTEEAGSGTVADLPFEVGENANGKLLPRSNDGEF